MVGVDGYVRVRQKDLQRISSGHGIFEGLGERVTGQQVMTLALFITPLPESLHGRFAVFSSVFELGSIREILVADVCFNAIQLTDQFKRLGCGFRICLFGTLKVTPCMRLILSSG